MKIISFLICCFLACSISYSQVDSLQREPKRVLVKSYDHLYGIAVAIPGLIWTGFLLKDASDARNTELNSKLPPSGNAKQKEYLAGGIGLVSAFILALALTPTEVYVDQSVSIVPTSNGVAVCIKF